MNDVVVNAASKQTSPHRMMLAIRVREHGMLEGAPHKRGKIVLRVDGWTSCHVGRNGFL